MRTGVDDPHPPADHVKSHKWPKVDDKGRGDAYHSGGAGARPRDFGVGYDDRSGAGPGPCGGVYA